MKQCAICNVEMTRKPREGFDRFENRKVCSLKCRQKYIVKCKLAKFVPAKCKYCGIEIHVTDRSGRRNSKRKFCGELHFRKYSRRENNPSWKGGVKKHGEYRQVLVGKQHPFADIAGYIMQHRVVMEAHLRQDTQKNRQYLVEKDGEYYLSPIVKVHHKNHVKNDNRIENLHPMLSQKEHFHFNFCQYCPHCSNKSGELLGRPHGDNQQPS